MFETLVASISTHFWTVTISSSNVLIEKEKKGKKISGLKTIHNEIKADHNWVEIDEIAC